MMENMTWKTGEFCWIDTMTSDLPKAKEFYNKVFGWQYDETPTPNGPYVFSKIEKGEVGGLSELSEEMKKQNIPSFWEAYVKVEDTDAIVAKAKELGGKVMAEPFDVMEYGRMAVLASPSGAAFCLWQSKDTKEAPRTSGMEHGMYGWIELNTNNVDADGAFYCNLFS
jgi:predicted enzyme related to lactoylglutathione lyase